MIPNYDIRPFFPRRVLNEPRLGTFEDYLASLRHQATPVVAIGQSPQWHAAREFCRLAVRSRLLEMTSIRTAPESATTKDIYDCYFHDLEMIQTLGEAVHDLLRAAADAQTVFVGVGRNEYGTRLPMSNDPEREWKEVVNAARARVLGGWLPPLRHTPAPLDAVWELRSPTPARARRLLGRDIERFVATTATDISETVRDGIETGVLGLVSWTGPGACWYARNERRYGLGGPTPAAAGDRRDATTCVTLADAVQLSGVPAAIGDCAHGLPFHAAGVMLRIPDVLAPLVGTVVGRTVLERDLSWEADRPGGRPEEVRWDGGADPDPAIVLGPVVLASWSAREHDARYWPARQLLRFNCWTARMLGSRGVSVGRTEVAS
jgi:hypothetical protein